MKNKNGACPLCGQIYSAELGTPKHCIFCTLPLRELKDKGSFFVDNDVALPKKTKANAATFIKDVGGWFEIKPIKGNVSVYYYLYGRWMEDGKQKSKYIGRV